MPGRTSAILWLTGSAQPPAPRRASKTPDPASFPEMLAEKSDAPPDTEDQRLLPASGLAAAPSTSTRPTRAAAPRLPVGVLLYLVSAGLVATATIGVFFGTGFFLLAHHAAETTAGSGSRDEGTEIKSPRSGVFQHSDDDAGRVLVETELPRSVAAAALPIIPFAEGPAAYQSIPLENSEVERGSVPGSPVGEAPVSAAGVTSSTEKVSVLRSAARRAIRTSPAQAVPAPRSKARTATLTPPSKIITTRGSRIIREQYWDFGPTLAAEKLRIRAGRRGPAMQMPAGDRSPADRPAPAAHRHPAATGFGSGRPTALLLSWGLSSQPRSPKRLGNRVAAGGHGIASGCVRLGGSETFLRSC